MSNKNNLKSIDDILFDSCQYLYNNPDQNGKEIINDEELKKCQQMFQFSFNSNNSSIQTNLLNNLSNTFNPIDGMYEKCKNHDACLNTILNDEVNLFENKLVGDKRYKVLQKDAKTITGLKKEMDNMNKELSDLQNESSAELPNKGWVPCDLDSSNNCQLWKKSDGGNNKYWECKTNPTMTIGENCTRPDSGSSLYNELIEKKKKEIGALNKNINNLISDYRENINEIYNGKINSQYKNLIYYYKMVEANKEIINNLENNSEYILKKNEIINTQLNDILYKYYILIGLIVIFIILNIATYYYLRK